MYCGLEKIEGENFAVEQIDSIIFDEIEMARKIFNIFFFHKDKPKFPKLILSFECYRSQKVQLQIIFEIIEQDSFSYIIFFDDIDRMTDVIYNCQTLMIRIYKLMQINNLNYFLLLLRRCHIETL